MNDQALLDRLGSAFAPTEVEPPPAVVAQLVAAVAEIAGGPAVGRRRAVAGAFAARGGSLFRRPVFAPFAAFAAVVGVTGTAYAATGQPLPSPVRSVAYSIGLPVDSPRLVEAQEERNRLRLALGGSDLSAISAAAAQLRADLSRLSQHEQARLGDMQRLLGRADALQPRPSAATASQAAAPSSPADEQGDGHGADASAPPAATGAAPSGGDQGQTQRGGAQDEQGSQNVQGGASDGAPPRPHASTHVSGGGNGNGNGNDQGGGGGGQDR